MERYLQIGKINLRFNLLPHLLIAIVFLCISPFLMGVENLNVYDTAKVLEMYVALLGIILLTPVFLPEQDKNIRDLIEAKYTSSVTVTLIRILESGIVLALLIGAYILLLIHNNCIFPGIKYYLGTLAEAFFLGSMGLCAYRLSDQIAVAYMLPMVYYIMNFGGGKKYLGDFFLFTMMTGGYRGKFYLGALGLVFLLVGVFYPYAGRKILPKLYGRKESCN